MTADHILEYGASRVVLATGSHWVGNGFGASGPDPIPGIDAETAAFVTPEQFFAGKATGSRVAVLDADGYFMGISIAEMLVDRGKQVTLVTHHEVPAPMTERTLEGYNLRRMMREKGIAERLSLWVSKAVADDTGVHLHLYDL